MKRVTFDLDGRLMVAVERMKMRWGVIVPEHLDGDAVEYEIVGIAIQAVA